MSGDTMTIPSNNSGSMTIEINGNTYDVPTSYDVMDIDMYLDLMHELSDDLKGNVECLIRILRVLTKEERSTLERVSLNSIKDLLSDLSFILKAPEIDRTIGPDQIIDIAGHNFKLIDYQKASVGEALFIENLMHNSENKVHMILDILACIVRPCDENGNTEEFDANKINERKEFFRTHLTVAQLHSLNFFLKLHAQDYLTGMK